MRDFTKSTRVVIKVGTNTLSKNDGVDTQYVRELARQVSEIVRMDKQVLLVSSGAIGMGAGVLKLQERPREIKLKQACAAIGQPLLMHEYSKAFDKHKLVIAQLLLTAEVLDNRSTYLNMRHSINKLLELGCIPIINENDSVSTAQIKTAFGDNDTLSALVASKIDADLLIILTDIDGLYNKDPRVSEDAEIIPAVFEITEEIEKSAGKAGSKHSTGGMKTKIEAAKIASNAGCRIVLANGHEENVLPRILNGEKIGTVFLPKRKLSNRVRWILNSQPAGNIRVDEGALNAMRKHKSLLPKGILSVEGVFEAESVVSINDTAKAVINMNSDEISQLIGKHSSAIRAILGPERKDVIANPENIVFLDY